MNTEQIAAEAADKIQDEVGRSSPNFAKVEAIIQSAIEKALSEREPTFDYDSYRIGHGHGKSDGAAHASEHRCDLPDSIKEALNSGDGTYRP